ncbi:MAG TPA: ABC transporter ATP-binding protein [Candidatus Anammoximicrobium sp.]|nr:ABC transporter ATP-binding protein [Candidatus Anammoximicrobium sp.]
MSHVISARGLTMRFPGCQALSGIDFEVPRGSVFALLGENAAGKTTLIRILTGFLQPTAGTCQVLGLDPTREALEIRRRIGYVAEAPALYDWMQVGEIGWFASAFYPPGFLDRYRDAVRRFELSPDWKLRRLSKGQRAKVALALALAPDPELLILDEPTSGLDPLVRREFLESMVDRAAVGKTVLLSSHQIAEVERVADHVAILRQGKFCLVRPLSELKESVSLVTVNLADPLIALPSLEGPAEVLSEQASGRQRQWIVMGFTSEHQQQLEQHPGVAGVAARSATLDEIFVACMRPLHQSSSESGSESASEPAYCEVPTA